MKKTLSLFLAAVTVALSALVFSACNDSATETIYYLNFKPEVADVYDEIARVYKEETGVELKVVTAASGTYEQTLKSEMAKDSAPTIFQINGPRGLATWRDYCMDLKNTSLYSMLTEKELAVTDGDGVYGIPYAIEGYGIIYNAEIMDRYFALKDRRTTVNKTEDINSFAELRAVVEDMTRLKKELGIEGVFASTSLKTGEDWRWQTHLAGIPIHLEFVDRKADLSGEDVKTIDFRYSDAFKNVFDLYINNSTTDRKLLGSKSVSDSMAEFALGRCAMVQNGNWAWSQIRDVAGNKVKEESIKFLPIYMGLEDEDEQGLCIGTENFLCINKQVDETKQKLSLEFLNWLFSSERGKKFVTEELDFISPFNTFKEEETPNDPLAREVIRWMNRSDVKTLPWSFTVFPGQTFKESFGAGLLSYAQQSKDFTAVKTEMIDKWKKESN